MFNGEQKICYAVITNDVSEAQVRVTEYDMDGFSGHQCHADVHIALNECVSMGYRRLATRSFDEVALTDSFQEGNERLENMHRAHRERSNAR